MNSDRSIQNRSVLRCNFSSGRCRCSASSSQQGLPHFTPAVKLVCTQLVERQLPAFCCTGQCRVCAFWIPHLLLWSRSKAYLNMDTCGRRRMKIQAGFSEAAMICGFLQSHGTTWLGKAKSFLFLPPVCTGIHPNWQSQKDEAVVSVMH